MYKLFFGSICFLFIFCGFQNPAQARLKVITTTTDLAAITREIGKDQVSVESIAKGYQDPHFVDAKPVYMIKLNQADLLIAVGLELEIGWLPPLLNGARNPNIMEGRAGYLEAYKGVHLLEVPSSQVDRSQGDVHPFGNPHFWLDPFNGKMIAKNIYEGLVQADPSQAAYFKNNLDQFNIQLDKKIKEWDQSMAPYRGTKVVTYHRSWTYFANHFGLKVIGEVEPLPGIPPSPSHLARLADNMVKEKVKVILMEPFYSDNGPEFLARNTGARVVVLPSSVGGREEVKTYFDLFDYDLRKLEEILRSDK
ncbi:MAG TPA: metal ABC transporter substrate-binding protein [Nitrospiria bacterium]|nr:metal ABC transporter substrate-binding protein [Nitrospiria bacterium]